MVFYVDCTLTWVSKGESFAEQYGKANDFLIHYHYSVDHVSTYIWVDLERYLLINYYLKSRSISS